MAQTLKALVAQISQQRSWEVRPAGEGYLFTLPQPQGRKQTVSVSPFEHEGETLIRITSAVGPKAKLSVDRYARALSLNLRLPYGCLAASDEELVLTETRPLKTTTARTTGAAIEYLARQADLYERMIYGGDAH